MKPLKFDRYTENLIEIAQAYVGLAAQYPELTNTDSLDWKQSFVSWANEFEKLHPDPTQWEHDDYYESIEMFAAQKILECGNIELSSFYFTFGSWERYPYQNAYLIVYAKDTHEAVAKYRKKHPDIRNNIVNCAAWYSEQGMKECKQRGTWYETGPAEIIW